MFEKILLGNVSIADLLSRLCEQIEDRDSKLNTPPNES